MVRPEAFAVKGQRAALKWNSRQLLDSRRFFPRIQARDAPIALALFGPAQDIDQPIDEDVAANLRMDRDLAEDVSLSVELQNPMLIPLAQVEMFAIIAQIGA